MEDNQIIKNFLGYSNELKADLYKKYDLSNKTLKKYGVTLDSTGYRSTNFIMFESIDEVRKNKLFKIYYNEYSDKYKKLIDHHLESYLYRPMNYIRGYRRNIKAIRTVILENFYAFDKADFDFAEYLQGKVYFERENSSYFYELIACEFRENKKVLDLFKAMVYDNENVQNISRDLIIGAIISNNKEAIETVFDLLKAAKLSEGLRSTIVNYIDYGSIETYKMFLEYIRSENLTRFSSVKVAIALFTGIESFCSEYNKNTKIADYVMDCILDNKTEEYLKDENPLKVYIGLYALSCYNMDDAIDYVNKNYLNAKSYIKSVYICFIRKSGEDINSKIITHFLENEENDAVKASIISYMPKVVFDNNECKRAFILIALENIKNLNPKLTFNIFDSEAKQGFSHQLSGLYRRILIYVEEIDDLYEEVYELFSKVSWYRYKVSIAENSDELAYIFLNEIRHPAQRKALIEGVSSNLSDVRKNCYEILMEFDIDFTEEEYFSLAKELKSKRSDLRVRICSLFTKADISIVLKVSKYLLEQKKAELKTGGLSILAENNDRIKEFVEYESLKSNRSDLRTRISSIFTKADTSNDCVKIFDEYESLKSLVLETEFPHEFSTLKNKILCVEDIIEEEKAETIELDVPNLIWDKSLVDKIMNYDFTLMKTLMEKWHDRFTKHFDEEIEVINWDKSKTTHVIGKTITSATYFLNGFLKNGEVYSKDKEFKSYEKYTFYEDYLDELNNLSEVDIAILRFMTVLVEKYDSNLSRINDGYVSRYYKDAIAQEDYLIKNKVLPNFKEMIKYINDIKKDENIRHKFRGFVSVTKMLCLYYYDHNDKLITKNEEYCKIMLNYLAYTVDFWKKNLDDPKWVELSEGKKIITFKCDNLDSLEYFDDNYAFDILKNLFHLYGEYFPNLDVIVYFYFLEKGLLNREYFISKLLNTDSSTIEDIATVLFRSSLKNNYDNKKYLPYIESIKDVYIETVSKMIEVELQRSDVETKYTKKLARLDVFYGVSTYAEILDKMKKIDFVRAYSYGNTYGIKDIFSEVLAKTKPDDGLTYEQFEKTIKQYKITDKKLLEASLYNRYFTKFGAEYLSIDGLEKAMYYFKAHSIDYANSLSDEEKTMINRFSDFDINDFVDGKMDIKWFKEIQEELSKEDYDKVYDASKFIMNTSKRKRGQYFADAVMGKLDLKEVESRIDDKRNQDMLLCFGLLPLGEGEAKEEETLRRYKRIQQFLKESKKFGAQRRATETRRSNIALSNLATNYGLNINRFTWVMEAKMIDAIKEVFEPKIVDEIEIYLSLEDVRNPKVMISKNGKALKSIPAKYKKDEYIVKINETKKDIKNQYVRIKTTLENAMTNSEIFSLEELELINKHLIVKEVIKDILFVSKGFVGFLKGTELINHKGEVCKLTKKSEVRIAHCVDLYESEWVEWQNYFMENQIAQPFKQVFRELYTLTEEELANDGYTQRFAGYQVDLKRARGVFNSRNWLLNEDDGFEKVNHAHDLRVDLYCYANWNNTNLAENVSFEKIKFINNKTNKTMDMKNLDKVLFSETMRDLDLVVSVAYIGGVDPLLNHTTLEMRKRILEHNLGLFKISNYKFTDKHILIDGTLGKYSIHLGSGVVSVEGKGMLPMIPVHSQHRGKIFLPFVDEDPKTAEIITKVIMLAEDNKLKDPTILQYLK